MVIRGDAERNSHLVLLKGFGCLPAAWAVIIIIFKFIGKQPRAIKSIVHQLHIQHALTRSKLCWSFLCYHHQLSTTNHQHKCHTFPESDKFSVVVAPVMKFSVCDERKNLSLPDKWTLLCDIDIMNVQQEVNKRDYDFFTWTIHRKFIHRKAGKQLAELNELVELSNALRMKLSVFNFNFIMSALSLCSL